MYLNKSGRYAYHTDFAVTNNLWLDSSTLRGQYWLRSAGVNNYTVCYVYTGGDLFDNNDVRSVGTGVRPALQITIQNRKSHLSKYTYNITKQKDLA